MDAVKALSSFCRVQIVTFVCLACPRVIVLRRKGYYFTFFAREGVVIKGVKGRPSKA